MSSDRKPVVNWNITGDFWTSPMLAASCHLHLIDGLRPLGFNVFTGRMGARGTDW